MKEQSDGSTRLVELMADPTSEARVPGKTPAAERRLVQLEQFARYSMEAGGFVLTKQRKTGRRKELGSRAGYAHVMGRNKYSQIGINNIKHLEHHLVWLWVTGEFVPTGLQIDHLDGDGLNNRVENLRAVTPSLNGRNRRKHKTNTSGESNVYWRPSGCQVQFKLNGKLQHFGIFKTLEEAVARRDEILAMNLGYTERHGK